MFLESSGKSKGDKAQLVSSKQQSLSDRCLRFYYHMFGGHINTLNVYQDSKVIWSRSANRGNVWIQGMVTLKSSPAPYEVGL